MTQLMYEGDPLEINGLFCVYMAGSVECALRQHPECMNADDCLFHRTDPGCGIERFYRQLAEGETPMMRNVNCRSDQARILVRSLVDYKGDFPEMIFGPPPGNNPDSFWVDLTEDQKNVLRAAYADAFGKLYGGKKIMVADHGHDEGSRAAAAACKVQGGALVIDAIVDNTDNSPNRNGDVMPLYLNSLKGLGEDRSIEIIPADETARIRSGHTADSTEIDGMKRVEDCRTPYESCILSKKDVRWLQRRYGMTGKYKKRLRKKQEQEINRRDRRFRDRTRKLKKLLEYQIRSLEFVFQGPPFGNKNPVITMDRRYAFPDAPNRAIEHIRNTAFNFLGLE